MGSLEVKPPLPTCWSPVFKEEPHPSRLTPDPLWSAMQGLQPPGCSQRCALAGYVSVALLTSSLKDKQEAKALLRRSGSTPSSLEGF